MGRAITVAVCLLAMFPAGGAHAFDKFLALGTSSTRGVYDPVGKAICRFINGGRIEHLVRCLAYNTGGSVYNRECPGLC